MESPVSTDGNKVKAKVPVLRNTRVICGGEELLWYQKADGKKTDLKTKATEVTPSAPKQKTAGKRVPVHACVSTRELRPTTHFF